MAIIIKTMDKPTSCWKCPFLTEAEWLCLVSKRHVYNVEQPIPAWCPIMDAQKLIDRVDEERAFLRARGQLAAEHILCHHLRPILEEIIIEGEGDGR